MLSRGSTSAGAVGSSKAEWAVNQWMQPERDLDGADLGAAGRDNVIGGERQFEAAAEAGAVHASNDRNR